MASPTPAYYSHIAYKQIYYTPEEDAEQPDEPLLVLDFFYLLYGEKVECNAEFQQRINDQSCNSSFLKEVITSLEPLPMELLMDPEQAEMARENMANQVASLAQSNVGVAELKILHVKVIVEVCDEETDIGLLSERRMTLVRTEETFEEASAHVDCIEEEGCAICLGEILAGEVMARTPCMHRFHAMCLRRWFENAGTCPLCRFIIDP